MEPIRITIARAVREMARDAGDAYIAQMCSCYIYENGYLGRKMPTEARIIREFYDAARGFAS
jgi:hypothetical protein